MYHGCEINVEKVLTTSIGGDTLFIVNILEKVKKIQVDRAINDTKMSLLLGYKNRTGWARIKGGVVPANEVFEMRAFRAFPELLVDPIESSQDSHSKGIKGLLDKIVLKVKKFV